MVKTYLNKHEVTVIDNYIKSICPFVFQSGLDEIGVENIDEYHLEWRQYWWIFGTSNFKIEINMDSSNCVNIYLFLNGKMYKNMAKINLTDPEFSTRLQGIVKLVNEW